MERVWIRKIYPGLEESWLRITGEFRRRFQSSIYAHREQSSVQIKKPERMKSLKVEDGCVFLSKLLFQGKQGNGIMYGMVLLS